MIDDLILLGNIGFDNILGMDWLASYHVILDCKQKNVCFDSPNGDQFCFQWDQSPITKNIIYVLEVRQLMTEGC